MTIMSSGASAYALLADEARARVDGSVNILDAVDRRTRAAARCLSDAALGSMAGPLRDEPAGGRVDRFGFEEYEEPVASTPPPVAPVRRAVRADYLDDDEITQTWLR